MNTRNLTWLIDIIFCLILLPMMIMLLPVERWLTHHTAFAVIFVLWLYAVYFIHRKVTMPMIFRWKNWWAPVLAFIGTVMVTWLVIQLDEPWHFSRHGGMEPRRPHRLFWLSPREQGVWFLFAVVTTFSIAVGLLTELYRQMLEKKELEQEKSKAELALYKAQINPHFLFNTLNTIYSLIVTRSDQAEQAFVQFTSMVKYLYSNASADFIPLSSEEEYIRQYIALQKFRLNEHTRVSFSADIRNPDALIAPMLLITFVENAFKYGVSSHNDSDIDISLVQEGNRIRFNVRNHVFPESLKKKGDGIGIANCRKRLSLIYQDAHTLRISDSGNIFKVELEINLKK